MWRSRPSLSTQRDWAPSGANSARWRSTIGWRWFSGIGKLLGTIGAEGGDDSVAELGGGRRATLVAGEHGRGDLLERGAQPGRLVGEAKPEVEQHRGRADRRGRVGDAPAGDVGGGAVDGLEE